MLTQQTISGGSSKELIKTHVSGGNSILPCVYDEKTGRFYGSLSFVATAKQAKAKVTSTEEDKVSQRELYQLVASQNLDAK
jgi:hypothetical protein